MARNDISRSLRKVDKRLDNMDTALDKLYTDTYASRPDDKEALGQITGTIEDNLDALLSRINGQEISEISDLYVRLMNRSGESVSQGQITKSIESLFDDNRNIIDTINVDNIRRSIQSEDYQYDLICKYMTKLEDALEIKKDNVLSSDNFTKDFINVISDKSNKDYINTFNDRAALVKERYNVQDLFDDMYYKASKYGEYFLYQVPYQRALQKLIDRKERLGLGVRYESAVDQVRSLTPQSQMIFESATVETKYKDIGLDESFMKEIKESGMQVKIVFDESGIIPQPISNVQESLTVIGRYESLCESYSRQNITTEAVSKGTLLFEDGLSTDGFIDPTKKNPNGKVTDQVKGSVIYEIPRANIIPIYMEKTPVGYIHINVANDFTETIALNGNSYNSSLNNSRLLADEVDKQNDLLVSYIASMMAQKIDAKFINANLDLKENIYAVLRYNDNFSTTRGTNMITVSFLPVEDVHHFYFKFNEKTHRGVSDLDKAIVPAMIYCLLYLNTTIGQIGRSQDKRVYYVKQNVEQNVARTLLNVINQLKKGNMGMRQLENMNTIFNIIGKYNDHIIPMSQSGDAPIQMEVMQGQQIDTPTEMLERMEDAAVSSTDVPLEFVQSVNSVDYAARFTMSNSKFLRKVYKRQRVCQQHFTVIFRKLYNYEYNENDTTMKILLPAPAFLAMSNSQQLIDNVKNYAQAISEIVLKPDEDEAVKQEFLNTYIRNQLGTYIDFNQIDEMINYSRMIVSASKNNTMDVDIDDDEF